jgi:membrane-bound lytic murein transglycosylase B
MRPIIPALAALALGEPRRRNYWEAELLNALVIIQRGWADPSEYGRFVGRRHGPYAMDARGLAQHGHRDYNKDGKITPFQPEDALGGYRVLYRQTRQISARRNLGLRGEARGRGFNRQLRRQEDQRTYAKWKDLGVARADGAAFGAAGRRGAAMDSRARAVRPS